MFFNKRTKEQPVNLFAIIPQRAIDWQETKDSKITLLKPKFSEVLLQKFFFRFLKQSYYQIHLDEIGTAVWRAIDGERTVEEIGIVLQEKFGKDIEPVYDRLGQFIGQLHRSRLITINTTKQ